MNQIYAALDVSDKATHICVVDGAGTIVWRGVSATDPEFQGPHTELKQLRAGGA